MKKLKVIISGGGTGGHIFPALAIADTLRQKLPDTEFLFVGARDRMEMEKVPAAGYPIRGLWISGIQRKLTLANLSFPLKLLSSVWKCRSILRSFRPDVAVGTGGFASGPLLYTAAKRGIPSLIQEQNSFPGITNRYLAKCAQKICTAYPGMERFFPASKTLLTGNPIRPDLKKNLPATDTARSHFGIREEAPTLLILGGSLGARRINQLVSESLDHLLEEGFNVIWQCGKLYYEEYQQIHGAKQSSRFVLTDFLSNMPEAFAAADLIVSRAGAGTLSELAVAKKACILVPSPNVAEDHQRKNAQALVDDEAAMMFEEKQSSEVFKKLVSELLQNAQQRQKLEKNIAGRALPDAAENIVEEILKLVGHGK